MELHIVVRWGPLAKMKYANYFFLSWHSTVEPFDAGRGPLLEIHTEIHMLMS
jgi:hypothetical protein